MFLFASHLQFAGVARRRCHWFGALLFWFPAFVGAQLLSPTPAPSSLPPFLQTLEHSGKARVLRSFTTDMPGLTGYVVRHGASVDLVYGESGYLFIGQLISPRGDDLTANYSARYLPKPDYAAAIKRLDGAGHMIIEGAHGAPVLYVFVDPNCIFCQRFYQMAEPLIAAGKLQVHWIVVGFLQSTSMGRAVAILSAKDPARAWHFNEHHFDVSHEKGGIKPDTAPHAALETLIKTRFSTMQSLGGNGTPTLLYRDGHQHWAAWIGLTTRQWLVDYANGKVGPNPSGASSR